MKEQSAEVIKISVEPREANHFHVSFQSRDFLGLFSVVAALFSSHGFNIVRGTVLTVRSTTQPSTVRIDLDVQTKVVPDWPALEADLTTSVQKAIAGQLEDVRRELHIRMVTFFRTHADSYLEKLYPVQLDIHQDLSESETVVDIRTQDTFAFLYELTNALSLLGINIVRMQIETKGKLVEDRLWLTTETGGKINSEQKLKELRWAILLVRQFTHMLPKVPDPIVALDQLASLGKEIFARSDFEKILLHLEESETLSHLSKLFGTSRFLWEEFIRTEHESLIPLLEDRTVLKKPKSQNMMKRELVRELKTANTFPLLCERLNRFKDQEMFRIDLRHLLRRTSYLEEFAEEFSDLCEVVVEAAYHVAWDETLKKIPEPLVSARQKSELSILALGKFGGRELGYASDLELFFVYTDHSDTTSAQSQKNLKFYTELVRQFRSVIWARQEGVFEIDLRLRPHGENGPPAVSLALFKNYYSRTGEAWSFERQALVKLRAIGGSPWLGKEVERLRDEFVYGEQPFDFDEALRLRAKQKSELIRPGMRNAKYGSGGLLDIEYLVQILQIVFGRKRKELRSTNTLQAMRALWQNGILEDAKFQVLRAAYLFLRDLINALRIFRGNAKDLRIPEKEELEFTVLGRRMGYEGSDEDIRAKLFEACARHTETASTFYQHWMAKLSKMKWEETSRIETRPVPPMRASLDEILKGELSESSRKSLLAAGFSEIPEAASVLRRLYPGTFAFEPFAKVWDQAWTIWPRVPDPDLALRHLERMQEASPEPSSFWESIGSSSEALARLLLLFGSSRYLSEILISHPAYWKLLSEEKARTLLTTQHTLRSLAEDRRTTEESREEHLDFLRKLRQRETFRIALVEMEKKSSPDVVFHVFSELADYILTEVFDTKEFNGQFSVLGLGKLGGDELNFSSDVDLMFVSKLSEPKANLQLIAHLQKCLIALAENRAEGFLYRVDMRLRPHGAAGSLAMTDVDSLDYYKTTAEPWEHQMLIKARPVAGDLAFGEAFVAKLEPTIYDRSWSPDPFERIREVKRRYEAQTRSRGEEFTNIKMGLGGIRDIEFSVQALQLLHAKNNPSLKGRRTLQAIPAIERLKLLSSKECETLREGYLFLRRVENKLQLYDNRQTFLIPKEPHGRRRLAKSLGFSDSEGQKAEDEFDISLRKTMSDCRAIFEKVFF